MTGAASRRRWLQGLQAVLALVLVVSVARQLIRNWREIATTNLQWRLEPARLILAALLTWSAYAGLIWSWRYLLKGWGYLLPPLRATRIWALASLGRYLPGKVWTVAGMAVLAQGAGVPIGVSTATAVILQVVALGTGVVVTVAVGRELLTALAIPFRVGAVVLAGLAAAVLAVLLVPQAARAVFRRGLGAEAGSPPPVAVLVAIGANALAWVLYGVAFWLVAKGVLPSVNLDLRTAIGAFATSYIVGLLAPFAPGGLGVRESVFIVVLRGVIGLAPAAALGVASRLFITVTELGFVLPFAFRWGETRRGAS